MNKVGKRKIKETFPKKVNPRNGFFQVPIRFLLEYPQCLWEISRQQREGERPRELSRGNRPIVLKRTRPLQKTPQTETNPGPTIRARGDHAVAGL